MNKTKIIVVLAIVATVIAFFAFDLGRYFSLDYFKSQQAAIAAYYQANPLQTAAIFFVIYVIAIGLSFPGAALLTLVGGAISVVMLARQGRLQFSFAEIMTRPTHLTRSGAKAPYGVAIACGVYLSMLLPSVIG